MSPVLPALWLAATGLRLVWSIEHDGRPMGRHDATEAIAANSISLALYWWFGFFTPLFGGAENHPVRPWLCVVVLVCAALSVGLAIARHGEKSGQHRPGILFVATLIVGAVMWRGGFFVPLVDWLR